LITANARTITGAHDVFTATTIERRDVGPHDVLIDISYAGICHSDIHRAHNDFGGTLYPFVPGHEIAGIVAAVGPAVTRFRLGDRAGVGCMVDSCRECDNCRAGQEQACRAGDLRTAGGIRPDGSQTEGGYSDKIVVDEAFVVRIPDSIPLPKAAPLMCAGVTMYSPLSRWNAGPGKRVAIIGFGGVGHIGTQISKALGAHTTVLDLSPDKKEDAHRLGADEYRVTTDPDTFKELAESLDLMICTVPARIDMDAYLGLLAMNGVLVTVGVPDEPVSYKPFSLLRLRRVIAGTRIGGLLETQEMLDFCGQHGVGAEVEIIDADRIDESYRRVLAGDVRFRFVIDASTIGQRGER
jgi:alcohol dehydrogenase (NADP+)